MSMPGLNYAYRSAALISPKGLVLGAISPAKYAKGQVLSEIQYLKKENPA